MTTPHALDVLCIGHASYDLIFSIDHHPLADEKLFADQLLGCGGGPAANAAVQVARLGLRAGFCGYLGSDTFGNAHLNELLAHEIETGLVKSGAAPTPLSSILVKPDGKRALVNYKSQTQALDSGTCDFKSYQTKVILADGHEPHLAIDALQQYGKHSVSVLDAGSVHSGTLALLDRVDYVVASEKFALQWANSVQAALEQLAAKAPVALITLGEHGIVWQRGQQSGQLCAPPAHVVDTTGAGDAFHGAFAAGLALDLAWNDLLEYASMAGALCCEHLGARPGLANREHLNHRLSAWRALTRQG